MPRLIYLMNTSVDGYTADRDGRIDWTSPTPEVFSAITELIQPVGTYLYGRRMYETMAVWQTAHLAPDSTPFSPSLGDLERAFADLWRSADKVVYSTTLPSASTPRTRIEGAFDPDQVRRVKESSDRDLTIGGPQLASAMLAAGLVDDIHAFVHPISLGGAVHLHYRIAR